MNRAFKNPKLILLEVLAILLSMIVIIPILIMVLGSLKTSAEADHFTLTLPARWMFHNYVEIFQKATLARSIMNSLIITIPAVFIVIMMSSLAAFVLGRKQSKLTKIVSVLFAAGLFIPVFLITTIQINKLLHLNGTFMGIILVYAATSMPWSVFLTTGFIRTVPKELDESAFVEGCSSLRLFYTIIFPLLQPIIMTNIIIIAMSIWNDFVFPLFLLNNSKYWTMPLTIYGFFGQYSRDWNLVFADLVVSLIPITTIYLIFQKYIVSGMTSGAVKG